MVFSEEKMVNITLNVLYYESWGRETFHVVTCFQSSLKASPNVMVQMNPQNILQAGDEPQDSTTPTMHLQEGLTEQDAVTESMLSMVLSSCRCHCVSKTASHVLYLRHLISPYHC